MKPLACRLLVSMWAAAMLLLAGCSDATLFRSNFDETAIGSPPAATQGVGTTAVAGPPGSVLVVAAPAGLNGKWLRLRRPNADTGFPEFQGILSQVRGEGRYTFSAIMFMPAVLRQAISHTAGRDHFSGGRPQADDRSRHQTWRGHCFRPRSRYV